jgi:hypothetical protein
VALELRVPLFFTRAVSVSGEPSIAVVGDQVMLVMTRSGFGAGVPMIWKSDACPPVAPELLMNFNCTSLNVADAAGMGIVIEFPFATGSKAYGCAGAGTIRTNVVLP